MECGPAVPYPQRINEKQSIIVEYESGKALPNQQILAKMERALGGWLSSKQTGVGVCVARVKSPSCLPHCTGTHLRGEKAGQPKMFGRGRGRGVM